MREDSIRFRRYVIDDGWNAPTGEPQEVFEEITIRLMKAYKDAYRDICREHDRHKGRYITSKIADYYEKRSRIYRFIYDNQYIHQVRELGEELQEKYGVTELEAINILNGRNIVDYVNKYYRIQNRIPLNINCEEIIEDTYIQCLGIAK